LVRKGGEALAAAGPLHRQPTSSAGQLLAALSQWPVFDWLRPVALSTLSLNKENLGKWAKNFGLALLGFLVVSTIFLLWGDRLKPGWFFVVVLLIILFPVGMLWAIGGMIVALFQKPD
jgi:hypothetical protein